MTNSARSARWAAPALGMALAVGVSGAAVAAQPHPSTAAGGAPARLEARLAASGDPDGAGEAHFRLSKARERVCANVEWRGIGTPMAAHIHRKSDSGVVVDLTGSVTGGAGCTTGVSAALIGRILAHPGRYYFNVHNATYPAGAIEGALRR